MADRTPPPGSPTAVDQGCRCPVLTNGHGAGIPQPDGTRHYWQSIGCPLHAPIDSDGDE